MDERGPGQVTDELAAGRREALDVLRGQLLADRIDVEDFERWAEALLHVDTAVALDSLVRALRAAPPAPSRTARPRRRSRALVLALLALGAVAVATVLASSEDHKPQPPPPLAAAPGTPAEAVSGPFAARRQYLTGIIERDALLAGCPASEVLLEDVQERDPGAPPRYDRLADYAPATLPTEQLANVYEEADDLDYTSGHLWLDAALSAFALRHGVQAEYASPDRRGPSVGVFVYELDGAATALAVRDRAIRAFVCTAGTEPWQPDPGLVGGRGDEMGEAVLTQVDGERVVFVIAWSGQSGVSVRDRALLQTAELVLDA